MPRTAFPLSKARQFRLGDGWHWRVVHFYCASTDYRLLVALHEYKQNACAMLGELAGSESMKVIAALETHSTHPGWHVHADCGMTATVVGRMRDPDMKRIPKGPGTFHKPHEGLLGPNDVLARAAKLFRLPSLGYGGPSADPNQASLWP